MSVDDSLTFDLLQFFIFHESCVGPYIIHYLSSSTMMRTGVSETPACSLFDPRKVLPFEGLLLLFLTKEENLEDLLHLRPKTIVSLQVRPRVVPGFPFVLLLLICPHKVVIFSENNVLLKIILVRTRSWGGRPISGIPPDPIPSTPTPRDFLVSSDGRRVVRVDDGRKIFPDLLEKVSGNSLRGRKVGPRKVGDDSVLESLRRNVLGPPEPTESRLR